jgi:hypothetical protein
VRLKERLEGRDAVGQLKAVMELWTFLRNSAKWWLLPVVVVLMAIGALLVFAGGSALAPFIYTMF